MTLLMLCVQHLHNGKIRSASPDAVIVNGCDPTEMIISCVASILSIGVGRWYVKLPDKTSRESGLTILEM